MIAPMASHGEMSGDPADQITGGVCITAGGRADRNPGGHVIGYYPSQFVGIFLMFIVIYLHGGGYVSEVGLAGGEF